MALQANAISTDSKTGMYDHVEIGERRASTAPSEREDKAKDLFAQAGHSVELTPENNKRVLSIIDRRILPVVLFIYFLQALDKATLSYASVFGLVTSAHLHGLQYSWLGSVVYLAQLVVQPLVAYLLVRLPVGKFLAFSVFAWGAVLSAMPAAHRFGGLLVCRMFLGVFEGGVAPAFIAITQMWWRRREQPVRLGAWYAMNGIATVFGSLLSYGLGHINSSHLASYQIIFLFCGLLTVVYSFLVLWQMPDSPMTTKMFKNEEDRLVAVERLRANQQGVKSNVWKWAHVMEAVLDPKTWLWAFMMFSISVPSGGISTFNGLIIKDFGFDKYETLLLNMPYGAITLIGALGGAYAATILKKKAPVLACLSILPIVGCVMLLVLPRGPTHKGPLLGAYYIISVYPGITPLIYSWSAANTAGETKKKVTTGFLIVFQSAGNVVGPTLYTTSESPTYYRGLRSNLALFIVLIVLYSIQCAILMVMNRRHGARREALGKTAKLQDISMDKVKVAENKEEFGGEPGQIGEKAFDDKTDWENEDFVYVY